MGFLLQYFHKLSAGLKFSLYEIFAFTENWDSGGGGGECAGL